MWQAFWQEPNGKENRGGGKYRDTPWQGHCTLSKAQEAEPEAQAVLEPTLAMSLSRA